MIEKAFPTLNRKDRSYTLWVAFLAGVIALGVYYYIRQFNEGMAITGMSRDISWGFYVANFTFFVGVAASAVMLVIPAYLHGFEKFKKIILFGEWLAVAAVSMCALFIMADMGQPQRFMNIILHPTPNSLLFWDMIVLLGYLLLNLTIGWMTLKSEKTGIPVAKWVKVLTYVSIPWAIGIHTVTAFLYAGLPGRHLWLTAILAPRFLASAFASGPALLLILLWLVKKLGNFEAPREATATLAKIMLYAMITNLFFYALEFFTAFYSNIPSHMHSLTYLFFGYEGHGKLVPWVWTSVILGFGAIFYLLSPKVRENSNMLTAGAVMIFLSTFIDKGMALVIGGFIPSPLEKVTEYAITWPEMAITLGIWAIGALIITMSYRMTLEVRREAER